MNLSSLMAQIDTTHVEGSLDVSVQGATADSRQVTDGSVFVAIPGTKVDGARFIDDAVERGARAIITQEPVELSGVTVAQVPSAREACAKLACAWMGHPSRHLKITGITGTNGKTTTAWLLESIYRAAGHLTGVTGTLGVRMGLRGLTRLDTPGLTTPDPFAFQETLGRFYAAGVTHVVSEVSSHALDQRRVDGTSFDVAVFTNLSQDHLDYHKDFHAYFAAKRRLFDALLYESEKDPVTAVVNVDDSRGKEIIRGLRSPIRVLTCSKDAHSDADIRPLDVTTSLRGIEGMIATPLGEIPFASSLIGGYNLSNLLAAVGAATALEIGGDAIAEGILTHRGAPGRLERVGSGKPTVLVDYAHTPDALANVLAVARDLVPDGSALFVVFGCGGDRDREKRPQMGEIAATYADRIFVTSDNPRSEDPDEIIEEILQGIESEEDLTVESDRRSAIRQAIAEADTDDVIVIAGKGHETYQVIDDETTYFDDRVEAAEALEERR